MNEANKNGSVFSDEYMKAFEYATEIPHLQPNELHAILSTLGYVKMNKFRYSNNVLDNAYHAILDNINRSKDWARYTVAKMRGLLESKKSKNIFITEAQASLILNKNQKVHTYHVDPDKVLLVKNFLDKSFKRGSYATLGEDGLSQQVDTVGMLAYDGTILKNMDSAQLFYLLQDHFKDIYRDKQKRDAFLKKVLVDWYYHKITPQGLLSVNTY